MNPAFSSFQKFITNGFNFRLFQLSKLPAAFFAGLKVESLTENTASISVKEKWFNKNPFGSIYFAILSMAAEVSTGILCLGAIYKRHPPVSMLVIKQEGVFHKKAKGKIIFICNDGLHVQQVVQNCINNNEAAAVTCHTKGFDESGALVAEFYFTWSFKGKGLSAS